MSTGTKMWTLSKAFSTTTIFDSISNCELCVSQLYYAHPTKTKIKGKLKVPPQLKDVYPDRRGIVEFVNKEHDISYMVQFYVHDLWCSSEAALL